jgi:hypothetical protein
MVLGRLEAHPWRGEHGQPEVAAIQAALVEELLTWMLRVQDPLPLPRRRCVIKTDARNDGRK